MDTKTLLEKIEEADEITIDDSPLLGTSSISIDHESQALGATWDTEEGCFEVNINNEGFALANILNDQIRAPDEDGNLCVITLFKLTKITL